MKKVIVTGINGFVGGHLIDELNNHGYGVIGIGREVEARGGIGSALDSYIQCDLAEYDQVRQLPLHQAEAVINLAGLAALGPSFNQPALYMRINSVVLDTLCMAAQEHFVTDTLRIIAVSSGAVYSPQQQMPLIEDSMLGRNSSPYAASKIAMEELSLKYREQGLDCVVARPFNHIGPGQMQGFLLPDLYAKVMAAKTSGEPLLVGNITTRRDYTDVRDVAKAYVSLVRADSLTDAIYNVCTGRSISGEQILSILAKELGAEELTPIVDEKLFRPSDAPDLYGDNSRLRSATGWSPTIAIEQTIHDFVVSLS